MYLHLGQDTVVEMSEVVGIFDLETSTISKLQENFWQNPEKSGKVINVSMEMPKTFILCKDHKEKYHRLYFSNIFFYFAEKNKVYERYFKCINCMIKDRERTDGMSNENQNKKVDYQDFILILLVKKK